MNFKRSTAIAQFEFFLNFVLWFILFLKGFFLLFYGTFRQVNPPFRFCILWLGVATKFTLLWCYFGAPAQGAADADPCAPLPQNRTRAV